MQDDHAQVIARHAREQYAKLQAEPPVAWTARKVRVLVATGTPGWIGSMDSQPSPRFIWPDRPYVCAFGALAEIPAEQYLDAHELTVLQALVDQLSTGDPENNYLRLLAHLTTRCAELKQRSQARIDAAKADERG